MTKRFYSYSGPPPCAVFKCENRQRCETEQLACKSFRSYVNSALLNEPTEPTKEFFKMVFDEHQDDEGNQMEKQIFVNISKTDADKQSATGVVFAPNKLDTQGDFMSTQGVEAAAEKFMKSGRTTNIDVNHNGVPVNAFISESFISKGGDFPAGSWVATAKIEDPDTWQRVKSGELTGFSMEGAGSRSPSKLNGKVAKLLSNVEVFAISLVKRGANKTKFAVVKTAKKTGVKAFDDATAQLEQVYAVLNKQQAHDAPTLTKGQQEEIDRRASRADYLTRFIKHCEDQIFGMYENPAPGWERREARLQERIEDAKAERYALGLEDNSFEKHSAFGGTSVVAPVTDPNLGHSTLGVTGNYSDVLKGDKPVGDNTMGVSEGRYTNLDSINLGSIK